ncbi:uncharacterized protein SPPG_08619 [Spizellomyces punctatus DAOM BR117]|uniref:Uncharacterized protein n=1 Tax=Spizellomyces punctatus (strain DAOM BR117) TaxID=645134 RepID=A0A0L0H4X8_SPIPD|nr:uncharacterized protein SPPG_08619 [Spizellomyces punctatus DAOM BR117]KNC96024.1 hypothetical protein SPPG_08619 [Spizellomyces punctatus DAOM BR117]|eukprot:XP_016604064.1 hypothetical protein SPPG_08619 [Spizellomyces punctatus DAOM BR117]
MDDVLQRILSQPSGQSSEQLSLVLRILEESRRLKEEERKDRELQLQILQVMTGDGRGQAQVESARPMNDLVALPAEVETLHDLECSSMHTSEDSMAFSDLFTSPMSEFVDINHEPPLNLLDPKNLDDSGTLDWAAQFEADFLNDIHVNKPRTDSLDSLDTRDLTRKVSNISLNPDCPLSPKACISPLHSNIQLIQTPPEYMWINQQCEVTDVQRHLRDGPNSSLPHVRTSCLTSYPRLPGESIITPTAPPYPYPFLVDEPSASSRSRSFRRGSSSSCKAPRVESDSGGDVESPQCSTPADVFRHAAWRASTRKRTVEDKCVCVDCRKQVGVLFLRGTQPSFEVPYVVDVRCGNCKEINPVDRSGADASSNSISGASGRKRLRAIPTVECDVCKRRIGSGGVRVGFTDEVGSEAGVEDWEEPSFNVELVCTPCGTKYLFCSECGGGGRHRTGKWRPRELFIPGRRTCSLPHIRIGDAAVQYRVLEVATELTDEALQGVQDVFFDCLISLYAIPSVIESRPGGYKDVRKEVESMWSQTVLDALTKDEHYAPKGTRRKYLTVAWVDKRHRNKGKFKQGGKEDVPWLARLALEGTVSPGSFPNVPPTTSTSANGASPSPLHTNSVYVAFSITEWNIPLKILYTLQISPRSVFLPTTTSYGELLRRGVERVQADARRDNVSPPEHLWCWAKADHARLTAIPERLGFVKKDAYIDNVNAFAGNEDQRLKEEWFDGSGLVGNMKDVVSGEGVTIYLMSVKEFGKVAGRRGR